MFEGDNEKLWMFLSTLKSSCSWEETGLYQDLESETTFKKSLNSKYKTKNKTLDAKQPL